jgi:hypothetical protein
MNIVFDQSAPDPKLMMAGVGPETPLVSRITSHIGGTCRMVQYAAGLTLAFDASLFKITSEFEPLDVAKSILREVVKIASILDLIRPVKTDAGDIVVSDEWFLSLMFPLSQAIRGSEEWPFEKFTRNEIALAIVHDCEQRWDEAERKEVQG